MNVKFVTNRAGKSEQFLVSQIANRIEDLIYNPKYGKRLTGIDPIIMLTEIIRSLYDGVKTTDLDDVAKKCALNNYTLSDDYECLAARFAINDHIKNVKYYLKQFDDNLMIAYVRAGEGVLNKIVSDCILANRQWLEELIDESYNYRYTYRGFYMLQRASYMICKHKTKIVIETPVYMLMRIAVGIVRDRSGSQLDESPLFTEEDKHNISEIFNTMKCGYYTHASPTIMNAGTIHNQYASCFLLHVKDNIESIMRMQTVSALCQKYTGGIGMYVNLRSKDRPICGTNGKSSSLVKFMKYTNALSDYIDQGGKRPGAISPQIRVHHPDLIDVLKLREINNEKKAKQEHNLHYCVIVCDYFIHCVENDLMWYFISTDMDPQMDDMHGEEFTKRYIENVEKGNYISKKPAREIMERILKIISIAGLPYMINIDNINYMRNQPVPIYSSNLCVEVNVPSNDKEVGVCNLASINIAKMCTKKMINPHDKYEMQSYKNPFSGIIYTVDINRIERTVRIMCRALNMTIDNGFYPAEECEYSNKLRRPIGIGIMGLADALCKLGLVFGSDEACRFRANIEELITWFAMDESCKLAQKFGPIADHNTYRSGMGELHPQRFAKRWPVKYDMICDWQNLTERVQQYGMRNSVLRSNMPTNNSSVIMGASPCFEPYVANIYKFNAFTTELMIVNKYIKRDLKYLGLDNDKFKRRFIELSGRVQNLELKYFTNEKIENDQFKLFKKIYRVAAFEISPNEIIDMCVAAQPFVDQAQSMNLWIAKLYTNFAQYLVRASKLGLKTLVYYTKTDSSTKEKLCNSCVM